MGREVELKFDCEPGVADRIASACEAGDGEGRRQSATYFDTKAGHVRKAGYSLRVRRSGDRFMQTVKSSAGSSAGLFNRHEWESEVEGLELDLAELDKTPLAKALGGNAKRNLMPLIHTDVSRTIWRVDRGGSEIELTVDAGEIRSGSRTAPIAELEMELRNGVATALFDLADELSEVIPLRLGVLSKDERGYALAEDRLGKAVKSEPIRLDGGMTVAEGFAAVANACLRHFRLNEMVLLESADAAALHQARVAMRRLRSALSLFRPAISGERFDALREELRWFTGRLGDARNIDVLAKRMKEADEAATLDPVVFEQLSEARSKAYGEVMKALESERFRKLMLGLIRWIEIGAWRSRPRAKKPLSGFASRRLGKRWIKVKSDGARLRDLDEESRHRLRIDIKKLRYSAEFFAGLYPDKAAVRKRRQFLDALETLQEELGALNDDATARTLIASLPLDAEAARTLERLLIVPAAEGKKLDKSEDAYRQLLESADYWETNGI